MKSDRIDASAEASPVPPRSGFKTRIGFARKWLEWRPAISSWQLSETILLSLVAFGLAYWAQPHDPLSLFGGPPWAWLAPVLLALRYGMRAGLLSATLLVIGWLLLSGANAPSPHFPTATLLGGLILIMVCGEFSSMWRHRLRRQTELNQYIGQRLQELTRQHYLLKLSHDRLEENLIARPYTLRGALIELRDLLKQTDGAESLPGAGAFMALMVTHCQLTVAALFSVRDGRLQRQAVASSGEPGELASDDPLVMHALDQRTLVHINQEQPRTDPVSRYLVAAPIYRDGELTGMLLVEQMPFFAFHRETLQTLAALISYYSDVHAAGPAQATLVRFPDCPLEFAQHLDRLSRVQEVSGVASHLAVLSFPNDGRGNTIRQRLLRGKRELDFYWLRDTPRMVLIGLFPLTSKEGMQGYLTRVDAWLEAEYGDDHRGLGIDFRSEPLGPGRAAEQLRTLIDHAA